MKAGPSIYETYFNQQLQFEEKYGPRTMLLIQIGMFYEALGYDPSIAVDKEQLPQDFISKIYTSNGWRKVGKAEELHEIINRQLTFKDKGKPHALNNPRMTGVPVAVYDNYRDLILQQNYTIIRLDQQHNKDETIERIVGEIVSPSTNLELPISSVNHFLVSVYLEIVKVIPNALNEMKLVCGLSMLDCLTGKSLVCETYSKETDRIFCLQEIYRFLLSHRPREIVISVTLPVGHSRKIIPDIESFLVKQLDLNKIPTVVFREVNPEYFKIEYDQQFLSKVFTGNFTALKEKAKPKIPSRLKIVSQDVATIPDDMITNLNLERLYYGMISYIQLLQYTYEHNETILVKLQAPDTSFIDEDRYCILTHNTINQLNVLPINDMTNERGEFGSLLDVINFTVTACGKRLLTQRLVNPLVRREDLERSYEMTDDLLNLPKEKLQSIDNSLKEIIDIERLQRRILLQTLKPPELVSLIKSYKAVEKLLREVESNTDARLKEILPPENVRADFYNTLAIFSNKIGLSALEQCKIYNKKGIPVTSTRSFGTLKDIFLHFQDNFIANNDNVLKLFEQYHACEGQLQAICSHLDSMVSTGKAKTPCIVLPDFEVKKKNGAKEDSVTEPGLDIDDDMSDEQDDQFDDKTSPRTYHYDFHLTTTAARATKLLKSNINERLCGKLKIVKNRSKNYITSPIIDDLCEKYVSLRTELESLLLKEYIVLLEDLSKQKFFGDVVKFVASLDFIRCNSLLVTERKYYKPTLITNAEKTSMLEIRNLRHPIIEKQIATEYVTNDLKLGDEGPYGLLIYGTNGCGKSALVKAVGLNVILAQAGLFTACQMTFSPYSKILTRLSTEDNLFKGLSSYEVEMSELGTILRNADARSLVLADELCRGTENVSGTSISLSAIVTLAKRKSSFLLATHLHDIAKEGLLGTDVSKGLVRLTHLSTTRDIEHNRLIYNRKLREGSGDTLYGLEVAAHLGLDKEFMELAYSFRRRILNKHEELLASKKSRYNAKVYVDHCVICNTTENLETHHLKQQKNADANGFIDNAHKDDKHNLVVLCKKCHDVLHGKKEEMLKQKTVGAVVVTRKTVPVESRK